MGEARGNADEGLCSAGVWIGFVDAIENSYQEHRHVVDKAIDRACLHSPFLAEVTSEHYQVQSISQLIKILCLELDPAEISSFRWFVLPGARL
jgi:hypothetical protein